MLAIIIQIISGVVGGNVVGRASEQVNGGTLMNSIVGALGGVGGAAILSNVMGLGAMEGGGLDLGGIKSVHGYWLRAYGRPGCIISRTLATTIVATHPIKLSHR